MSTKKLVLQVVADVKDAKAGLAEVGQGIKGLFQGSATAGKNIVDGGLAAFDGLRGAMQKVLPVASTVLEVSEKAIEMAQFAGQREILERSISSDGFDKLRAATRGLVDDQTLLQAAAKGLRGDFALTEDQLANVSAAAVTLHNRGFGPIPDIINEISKSLAEGEGEALKKYGISLGETGTKAEKLGRAHVAMAQLAADADGNLVDSGTAVTQMLVKLKNIWDDLKVAIGVVVDVLAVGVNFMIDATADIGDFIGHVGASIVSLGDLVEAQNEVFTSVRGVKNEVQEAAERQEAMNRAAQTGIDFLHRLGEEYGRVSEQVRQVFGSETEFEARVRRFKQFTELHKLAVAADEERAKEAKKIREKALAEEKKDWADFTKSLDQVMDHRLELIKRNEEAEVASVARITSVYEEHLTRFKERNAEIQNALAPLANDNAMRDPGILRLQGMAKAGVTAAKAFDMMKASGLQSFGKLTEAAATSLQAIIAGSAGAQASMGEIFKQLLDQLGTELQIEALKYLGLATAALVTNPAGAPNLFAAAGILEAGALAAGVAERLVGAPSAAGAGGGGAANNNAGAANNAGRDTVQVGQVTGTVIHQYYVNGFIGDEARLAREMEAMRRRSELSGAVSTRRSARRA